MVKISIVTISFNQTKYLETCIRSITGQNKNLFEFIVVDPGSTDGSRAIISSHASEIDHIILEKDKGPADGLNKGFDAASGEYLMFINADDFLLPMALDKIAKLLDTYNQPALLLCGGWLVDQNNAPLRRLFSTRFSTQGLVNHRAAMFQQGMVIRRDLFERIGGFNKDNYTCWDFELLVDCIIARAKPKIDLTRVAAFRIHAESISGGHFGTGIEDCLAADLIRIHDKLKPDEKHQSINNLNLLARVEKYIRTPEIIPFIIHDKLLKHRIKKAWEKDILR